MFVQREEKNHKKLVAFRCVHRFTQRLLLSGNEYKSTSIIVIHFIIHHVSVPYFQIKPTNFNKIVARSASLTRHLISTHEFTIFPGDYSAHHINGRLLFKFPIHIYYQHFDGRCEIAWLAYIDIVQHVFSMQTF